MGTHLGVYMYADQGNKHQHMYVMYVHRTRWWQCRRWWRTLSATQIVDSTTCRSTFDPALPVAFSNKFVLKRDDLLRTPTLM